MTPKENEGQAEGLLKETSDGGYVVDMTQVQEPSTEVLPKAIYNCEIDECEYKLSQASGLPMWAMILVVSDGEYQGRKFFNNMSFSEKALPYTKRSLAAIAPELLTVDFRPDAVDQYDMVGKRVRVQSKIGKNENGEKRSEVAKLLPPADNTAFMGQT